MARCKFCKDTLTAEAHRKGVHEYVDRFGMSDWFCTRTPFKSMDEIPLTSRLMAISHLKCFYTAWNRDLRLGEQRVKDMQEDFSRAAATPEKLEAFKRSKFAEGDAHHYPHEHVGPIPLDHIRWHMYYAHGLDRDAAMTLKFAELFQAHYESHVALLAARKVAAASGDPGAKFASGRAALSAKIADREADVTKDDPSVENWRDYSTISAEVGDIAANASPAVLSELYEGILDDDQDSDAV